MSTIFQVCKTHARGRGGGEKIDNFNIGFFFTFRIFFLCPRSSVLFYCCFVCITFVRLNIKRIQTPMWYLILTPIIFLKHHSTNNPVWECSKSQWGLQHGANARTPLYILHAVYTCHACASSTAIHLSYKKQILYNNAYLYLTKIYWKHKIKQL